MKLLASITYNQLSKEQRKLYGNGCGPWWMPTIFRSALNKIFGESVCEACNIHDYDYHYRVPRHIADNRFKKNLLMMARESAKDRRMLWARSAVAYIYFFAVRIGGVFSYRR